MKITSPPDGSRIEVAEASDARVVMTIPPGGKRARGMGCFALAWLAITVPVGLTFLWATVDPEVKWEGDGRPPLWGIGLFFAVFWSIGLGMGYVALRMRFESLMLCLEPDRLSIQRSFLGRKKLSTIELNENSCADMELSYTENDVPVYRIRIDGVSRKETFGTALTRNEKQWVSQTINRFLGHEPDDRRDSRSGENKFCRECGTRLMITEESRFCPDCGEVYFEDDEPGDSSVASGKSLPAPADVAPEDLPVGCGLKVEDDSGEQLTVSFLLNPSTALRVIIGGMPLMFSFVWFGIAGFMAWSAITDAADGSGVFVIMILFIGCLGFVPLLLGLAVAFGRAQVTIGRDLISVRYHVGPIGFSRAIPTDSVQDVVLTKGSELRSSSQRVPKALPSVQVETTGKPLILTLASKESISHNLCGVVRYQIHRLGFRLVSD